ncbi:PDZ domain-containing protein [Kocuria massiliensis]|uniref:YlbL family protein n=1 Tax=Kocuria massiliensis TaxID=1926282 RepID=UPI0022B9931A|nr:S16 family serine protease [Kocuria massiliensis]
MSKPQTRRLRTRRFRRPQLGTVAGLVTLVLVAAGALLPPKFVTEGAGPTFNTIGEHDGKQLISITGHPTYPPKGELDMTTVYVSGGPNGPTGALNVLSAWLNPDRTALPSDALYDPSMTRQQVSSQNTSDMTDSQTSAQAAAATYLSMDYSTTLTVMGATDDAAARLNHGDVLTSVDGQPLKNYDQLKKALADGKGSPMNLGYTTSGGEKRTITVEPTRDQSSGQYRLGLYLKSDYSFPFQVNYGLEQVGGPSAGMMFTLGIIDELTEGDMTGGRHFAGTGTIDAGGKVGPIGGIRQKMIGAKSDGASVFLAPVDNCDEVIGHIPDGLSVVKVGSIDEAVHAVEAVGQGKDPSALPQCTG